MSGVAPSTSVDGLISGLNTSDIISKLMQIERQPQDALKNQLALLNQRKAMGDLVIYVSDNESWVDAPHYGRMGDSATRTMLEWSRFRERNPGARMVCIDIQPYGTVQAKEREDIFNVGGFSDNGDIFFGGLFVEAGREQTIVF